ncbi:uncharacterized protein LOC123263350 [Cotesia glomerata]|uniref:uncharacterized protein LOC123263350 n=1 Tax=Cotesia glomerata TaxID=32391 RepID=UPI001D02364F|nr:uncharacterized protein LOC123263350 [Cotesia glomerata]
MIMKWRILLCLWFLSSLDSMGIEKNQEYHFDDDDFDTRHLYGFHGGRKSQDDVVQRIFFNVKTDVWYLKRQMKKLNHQSDIIISNISRLMTSHDAVDDVKNSLYELTTNISQFYNSMKKNYNGIKNNYYILSSNVSDVSQRFDIVESLWPGILMQVNSTIERISDLADSHNELKQLSRQQGHLITSGIGRLEQKLDVSLAAHNMEVSRLRNDIVSYVLNVQDQVMEVQRAVEKIFQCSCLAPGSTRSPPGPSSTPFNGQYTVTSPPYKPTLRPSTQPPTYAPPPNGQPPYGPPNGRPPNGWPPNGQPPNGQPPNGQPPNGQPPSGQPPSGRPPNGQPPYGQPPNGQPPNGQPPNGQPPTYEITTTYRPLYSPSTSTTSRVYEETTSYYSTSDRTTTTHKPMLMQPPIQLGFDGPFKDMCVCICSCPCNCPTFSAMLFPKQYTRELSAWINYYYKSYGVAQSASSCSCLCACPCDGSDISTSGPSRTELIDTTTPFNIPETTQSFTTLFTTEHFDIDIDIGNGVGGWPDNSQPPLSTTLPPPDETDQFVQCVLGLCSKGQRIEQEIETFKKVMLETMEGNKVALISHLNARTDDLRHFLTDIHSSTYNLNYDNKNTTILMHIEMRKKFDEMHYLIKVVSDILVKLNHEIDIIQSKISSNKPNLGNNKPSNGDNYQSNYDPHDFNNPNNWPHSRLLPDINMVNSNKSKTKSFYELRKNISNITQQDNPSKNNSTVGLKSDKKMMIYR